MSSPIELVNVPPTITWGTMEPLALALLAASAMGMLVAGVLTLAHRQVGSRRMLMTTAIATLLTGLAALSLSLGNPMHIYMFLISPSFSSWTTIGTFLLPVFLVVSLLTLYLDANHAPAVKGVTVLAMLLALGVLTYASREVGYLQGRELWHLKALPLAYVLGGFAGITGLTALHRFLWHGTIARWLVLGMALTSLLVSAMAFLLTPPAGFVLTAPGVWTALSVLGVAAAVVALLGLRLSGLVPLAGLLAFCAELGFFIRLIFLGQSIPRNSFTMVDAGAASRLLSVPSILTLVGSVVAVLVLGMIVGGLFKESAAERRQAYHG